MLLQWGELCGQVQTLIRISSVNLNYVNNKRAARSADAFSSYGPTKYVTSYNEVSVLCWPKPRDA